MDSMPLLSGGVQVLSAELGNTVGYRESLLVSLCRLGKGSSMRLNEYPRGRLDEQ